MVSSNNNDTRQNGDPFNLDALIQNPTANRQVQPRCDEVDPRDGQPSSSSTQASRRLKSQQEDNNFTHVNVSVPENTDPTTTLLLTTINQTNRLLYQQN